MSSIILGCRIVIALAVAATYSGCQPSAQDAERMLDHFRSNAAARNAKIEECKQTAGFLREEFECQMAAEALRLAGGRRLRDRAPMGLIPPPEDEKPEAAPR